MLPSLAWLGKTPPFYSCSTNENRRNQVLRKQLTAVAAAMVALVKAEESVCLRAILSYPFSLRHVIDRDFRLHKTRAFLVSFRSVCPESVLANDRFFQEIAPKEGVFRTA